MLYRTRGAKLPLPERVTRVHPLASSGKKETVMTELKDALVDFLGQMGQSQENYLQRLVPVGGDGLMYEKMLQLKRYLQFHSDPFEGFELVEPTLEAWHTEWTGLSCNFETHWGALLSDDPATLGHSAHKIDRAEPANLSKVDYYPAAEAAFLTLDLRVLDCWRWVLICFLQDYNSLNTMGVALHLEPRKSSAILSCYMLRKSYPISKMWRLLYHFNRKFSHVSQGAVN
jgi:hypothetical protein